MNGNTFDNIGYQGDGNVEASSNRTPSNVDDSSLEEQKRARYEMDTQFRSEFSYWVMIIIPVWLVLILVIVFLQGFRIFRLSPTETVALLATTSANVLGLAYIVLKGFFGTEK